MKFKPTKPRLLPPTLRTKNPGEAAVAAGVTLRGGAASGAAAAAVQRQRPACCRAAVAHHVRAALAAQHPVVARRLAAARAAPIGAGAEREVDHVVCAAGHADKFNIRCVGTSRQKRGLQHHIKSILNILLTLPPHLQVNLVPQPCPQNNPTQTSARAGHPCAPSLRTVLSFTAAVSRSQRGGRGRPSPSSHEVRLPGVCLPDGGEDSATVPEGTLHPRHPNPYEQVLVLLMSGIPGASANAVGA